MNSVWIALGSNIDAEANLRAAAKHLREHWPAIRFASVYNTAAREVENQADFLNTAAVFESDQSATEVITILRSIEQTLGKSPPYRFGPRTIDLDLLLFGDAIMNESDLIVPHPRMHERRFVLEPLCELIDSRSFHPLLHTSWQSLLEQTRHQSAKRTAIIL